MPTAREASADRGDRATPAVVRWGFYVIVAAVAIGIFDGVFLMMNKDTLIDNVLELEGNARLSRAEADSSVTRGLWVFIVISVLFGALQALFAYKAQEGVRRARMLVTILTVVVVLFHEAILPA